MHPNTDTAPCTGEPRQICMQLQAAVVKSELQHAPQLAVCQHHRPKRLDVESTCRPVGQTVCEVLRARQLRPSFSALLPIAMRGVGQRTV